MSGKAVLQVIETLDGVKALLCGNTLTGSNEDKDASLSPLWDDNRVKRKG